MFIDSHCHLAYKSPDSKNPENIDAGHLEAVLARAAEAGVDFIINVGAGEGIEGNLKALEQTRQYPQIFGTVGVHPHDATLWNEEAEKQILTWAQDEKVVALGEMGLDYHYEHSPREIQKKVFTRQIELAIQMNKPIMIHDRDAGFETFDILKSYNLPENKIMIHCFTGSKELAKKYLDIGCLLSFTGIITFKKSTDLQDIVRSTPIERMLIETDAPYLSPEPFRGKVNEPAFVRYVAEKVAALKGLSVEDVGRITSLTANRFFNLPVPQMEAQVAYAIRDSLYLNITNRCTLACVFCPKFIDYEVKGYYLKLPKEPTVDEIMTSIGDATKYKEVVFCGYGEPTRRLDALLEVGKKLKNKFPQIKLRLNTDGLGNKVHGRNILEDLSQVIDSVSVSLNASDAETYAKICPNKFKEEAYPAVKDFIKLATQYIPEVMASAVGMPGVDIEKCRQIVEEELGAKFRNREYNNVG